MLNLLMAGGQCQAAAAGEERGDWKCAGNAGKVRCVVWAPLSSFFSLSFIHFHHLKRLRKEEKTDMNRLGILSCL